MKKYLLGSAVLLASLAFSVSAMAHPMGYGDAGCGPGSLIYGKHRDGAQVLAAMANNPITQSTAITFGTSNCGDSKLSQKQQEREDFANINYNSLVKEMAVGQGENLETLANLYGCSEDSYGQFGSLTQKNFSQIVKDEETSSNDMLNSLEKQISGDEVLSRTCTGVIG